MSSILSALTQHLAQHSLVFWHDTDQQADMALFMALPADVQVVRIDEMAALAVKQLYRQQAQQKAWLFYSTQPEPVFEDDWLLNIRLQAKTFYADATSMQMDALGLQNHAVRDHLKQREKFLRAKDRLNKLSRFTYATDNEQQLDLKMIAVLAGAEQPELTAIIFKAIEQLSRQLHNDSKDEPIPLITDCHNYGLAETFWQLVQAQYGYESEQPSIMDLLVKLLVSDFISHLSEQPILPSRLSVHYLKDHKQVASAVVLVSQWRNHLALTVAYREISASVAELVQLAEVLADMPLVSLSRCYTFLLIEKLVIAQLRDHLLTSNPDAALIEQTISDRQAGYWVAIASQQSDDPELIAYHASYRALQAALSYKRLQASYQAGFSFSDALQALEVYRTQLYQFDQFYRIYHQAAEITVNAGWAVLNSLSDSIERAYVDGFMPQLASAWAKVVEGEQGLLSNWQLAGWQPQQNFYLDKVLPYFNQGVKRVFVVISDAMRYEVADSLVKQLNAKNRYNACLNTMLGVLPSYTSLGMAALLPHETLSYKRTANGISLTVDGMPTSSVEHRHVVLAAHQGIAIKMDDLIAKGKQGGREFVRDAKVVYVYHDRIDMVGDKQGTELETFTAVEQTLQELSNLCGFLINNLNAGTVLITADHGFIYQQSEMDELNRVDVAPPAGCIINKKRFMIGDHFPASQKVWTGNTATTASTEVGEGSVDFWLPKGAGRFRFTGGARFVHGGAMPQEVVVPLIEIKVTEAEKDRTRLVTFSQIGMSNRVVSNRQRFEFVQNEPVSDKVQAVQVIVSLQDGDTLISDEQIIHFNSESDRMDERRFSVYLTVKSGHYDSQHDYALVIRNAANKYELSRTPMRITIAFSNDF